MNLNDANLIPKNCYKLKLTKKNEVAWGKSCLGQIYFNISLVFIIQGVAFATHRRAHVEFSEDRKPFEKDRRNFFLCAVILTVKLGQIQKK